MIGVANRVFLSTPTTSCIRRIRFDVCETDGSGPTVETGVAVSATDGFFEVLLYPFLLENSETGAGHNHVGTVDGGLVGGLVSHPASEGDLSTLNGPLRGISNADY